MMGNEPTIEQCEMHVAVLSPHNQPGIACWYPSMGGHPAKAIVVPLPTNDDTDMCFDVYVWHDGEFPFKGEGDWGKRPPTELHHCSPDEFIEFGGFLKGLERMT